MSNTFRDPAFEYLKDLKWQGFEKLDGTNVRIYWDGYRVSTHGRTDNALEIEKNCEARKTIKNGSLVDRYSIV